jgi:RHS repeat-associated protein
VAGSVGYTYDANFRVTALTVNGTDSIALAYDQDNLLTSAGSLTLARDAQNGRLTGTTLGSLATTLTYDDSVGTLKRNTATYNAATLLDFQYTRDTLDRITQLIETVQGTAQTWIYAYDSVGRLDQVRLNGVLVSDYTYDGNGNRIGLTTQSGSLSGTVDDQDRLLTYGTNSYTYTSNGELTMKVSGPDTTRYTYDVLGNLLQARLPNGTVIDYLVDGQQRRIGRKVNGVLVQGFLYQGLLAPIAELDGSNQIVSRFVYGTRVNVPEYVIKGGVTYRLLTDHLGSVRLVVNTSDGSVVQRIDYDEFGRVTQNTNPGFQPFGFAGGLYDDATKLVRFGARDYDAETGRWTAKDPISFAAGSSNLLTYAFEDPLNVIDLDGMQGLVGAIVGGTFELGLQLWRGGWNIRCIDIADVVVMAGIGAVTPGWLRTARDVKNSIGAAAELTKQLGRTQSAARAAKLQGRIGRHKGAIGEALVTQGLVQAAKRFGREVAGGGSSPCPCPQ